MNSLLRALALDALQSTVAAAVRERVHRAVTSIALYLAAGLFGLAALAFAYVLAYRLLATSVGDEEAAAILLGANLVLAALILAVRAIYLRPSRSGRRPGTAAKPLSEIGGPTQAGLAAGIALGKQIGEKGRQIGEKVSKSTPKIALIAAVAGLIIGLRPELLGLLRRRPPRSKG